MKNFGRFSITFLIAWMAALLFFAPISVVAENIPATSKIAFLRLQVDSTGFRLIDATVVDGSFKSPRDESINKEYSYELVGIDSTVLFKGAFENPLIKRYEYEDPEHPGQLLSKTVELSRTEITVRVPFSTNIQKLNIHRLADSANSSKTTPDYRLIMSISLSAIVTGKDK